jgi:hypothetical protein
MPIRINSTVGGETTKSYRSLDTSRVPRFLAPADAVKAIGAYQAMVKEFNAFMAELRAAVNDGEEGKAKAADTAAVRALVEAGKPVKDLTKNHDAYKAAAAGYEVQYSVWLSRLVDAEKLVKVELDRPGDEATIERALQIAEERAQPYRDAIAAMLEARDHYMAGMDAVRWAVQQTTHDDTKAVIPPGKILPRVEHPKDPLDVSSVMADAERHKMRLDALFGNTHGSKEVLNAAKRFVYGRLKDDPDYKPEGERKRGNRYYGY